MHIFAAYSFYGPTFENEHLYRIALRVRPKQDISIPQMMVAILRVNPNAFVQHNINALKAGYHLNLPPLAVIRQVSPAEAAQIVNYQNKIWEKRSDNKVHVVKKTKKKTTKKVEKALIDDTSNTAKNSLNTSPAKHSLSTASNVQKQDNQLVSSTSMDQQKEQLNTLSDKLNEVIEANKVAALQTENQINKINEQVKLIQAKVNKAETQLQSLSYQLVHLTSKHAQDTTNFNRILLINLKHNSVGLTAAFATLVFLSYLLFRTFKPNLKTSLQPDIKKSDEYDFMNSRESIPAKLDLARAYIDMGDSASAETALKDVLKNGNKEQRKQARDLLDTLT